MGILSVHLFVNFVMHIGEAHRNDSTYRENFFFTKYCCESNGVAVSRRVRHIVEMKNVR